MRTKPCARYVARVVDLSRPNPTPTGMSGGHFVQYPTSFNPIPSQPAPVVNPFRMPSPIAMSMPPVTVDTSVQSTAALKQQRKKKTPATEGQKAVPLTVRNYRTKQRTKDGKVKKDGGVAGGVNVINSNTASNIPAALVQGNPNGGLYRFDFSRLIEHNLHGSQQRSGMLPGTPVVRPGGAPVVDQRFANADHTLNMWRQLMMASIALQRNQQTILRTPQTAQGVGMPAPSVATGGRFSIFRSVELMAQSSCPSAMGRK